MSQGRFTFLGYQAYASQYYAEIDYYDGSSSTSYTTPNFNQSPGAVFGIPSCVQITAVRVKDAVTSAVMASFSSFNDDCGSCWGTSVMTGPYKITWNPDRTVVVVSDENLITPPPDGE